MSSAGNSYLSFTLLFRTEYAQGSISLSSDNHVPEPLVFLEHWLCDEQEADQVYFVETGLLPPCTPSSLQRQAPLWRLSPLFPTLRLPGHGSQRSLPEEALWVRLCRGPLAPGSYCPCSEPLPLRALKMGTSHGSQVLFIAFAGSLKYMSLIHLLMCFTSVFLIKCKHHGGSGQHPAWLTEAFHKDLWVNGFCYRQSIFFGGLLKRRFLFFFFLRLRTQNDSRNSYIK